MRRLGLIGLGVAGVLALGAAAPAGLPLETLLDDVRTAKAYDYPGLPGDQAKALRDQARAAIAQRHGGDQNSCRTQAEAWVEQGLEAAVEGRDRATWRDDKVHAQQTFDRAVALRRAVVDGGKTGDLDMDREMAAIQGDVAAAPTPRARELERRVLSDQFNRRFYMGVSDRLGQGLSPGARKVFDALFAVEICDDDNRNLAWIRGQIERDGWFSISRDGAAADHGAWLLVQHADDDVAYQEKILGLLAEFKARGDTSAKNYAYLHDRVAVNRGRPQRYGTQGGCKDGQRFTGPLEDPARVDALRAEVGLKPLAEYNALFRCRKPAG